MACIDSTKRKTAGRKRQSTRGILARFEDEREILSRLPRVITGNRGAAEQSVGETRGLVTNGAHPHLFREQLLQWLKWGTIKVAITNSLYEIACCESKYVNQNCTHSEHVLNGNDLKLGEFRSFLWQIDPETVIAELEPLARAVAVLRTTARASILDCVSWFQLSLDTVLAANWRAMTWFVEKRTGLSHKALTPEPKEENP